MIGSFAGRRRDGPVAGRAPLRLALGALPRGGALPPDVWRVRHRVILVLLWLHALGIAGYALIQRLEPPHALLESGVVALAAVGAGAGLGSQRARSALASLGLMTASAMLVHLSGGYIELHFHFFVIIAVITLYQDWVPLLVGIGFVVLEHGLIGMLNPTAVYNHPAAWQEPWKWAALHGGFVLAQTLACLAGWRLSEATLGALRASERRFRTVFERAAVGLTRIDREGRYVQVNLALQGMLGYSEEELVGKHIADLTHPADCELSRRKFDELRDGTWHHYEIEKRFCRRDGSVLWVHVSVSAIRDRSGALEFCTAVYEDITERKEAERQLHSLAQAEKLRALGQMASGVAHDLNQSLAMVAGYGDLARQALREPEPDLEQLRDALDIMARAAMDGGETVKRLLAFSRPRPDGVLEPIDLGELLRDVAKLTAPRWRDVAQEQGRPISLHVENAGRLIISGWPSSLREALTNLVFNAVDAMPRGGTILLRARCVGAHVEAEVSDSGIGMSDEVQARIFEPFFSTKGERGTGLGLSMVFGIVERHGGQITVESVPGAGTTFRLRFPAAELPDSTTPTPAEDERLPAPADPPSGGLRILAVDDEPKLVHMLRRTLETDGHRVCVVSSGEEALERLGEGSYDLVFSDVGMGEGMNGWELADQVRARHPELAFCLATGWGAQIDPVAASERGVLAVVAKPYRLADLRRTVEAVTARVRAPRHVT